MTTGKGLDGQMDSLMAFEIMVSIEALRALVTFKGPILRLLLGVCLGCHVYMGNLSVVGIACHQPIRHSPDQSHLGSWTVKIGHDGTSHGGQGIVVIWSSIMGRRPLRLLHDAV